MVELTKNFLLKCEELDKDHKRLVEMVNDITDDIDKGATGNTYISFLNFVNFAKEHFSREEKLLKKSSYSEMEKHHKHHQTLIAKMLHMQEFAASAEISELACVSLKKELVYFLMDDLITTDIAFKGHLDNVQE